MRKALGIDVGGTKIYSAIINEKGEILSEIEKYHTPKTFVEIHTTRLLAVAFFRISATSVISTIKVD